MSESLESVKRISPADRYRIFAKTYLVELNATKSAIAAGYSEKTAHSAGSRLLRHVKVREIINKSIEKRVEKLDISGEKTLENLAEIAYMNMAPSKFKPDHKIRSLELLGRYQKLFHESGVSNTATFNIVFTDAERQKAIDIAVRLMDD